MKEAQAMTPVELREIKLILAVSEERSFTRAAQRCCITQPALSKAVRRAERALGTLVFDRSSSPLQITPEGKKILEYLKRITAVYNELENYCGSLRLHRGLNLAVGAPAFFCTYVLPPVISAWQLENPDFSIRLIETNESELRRLLSAGLLDMGLTVETPPPDTESFVLQTEGIVLAVPKKCAINAKLAKFRLSEKALRSLGGDVPRVPMKVFAHEKFLFLKEGNDIRTRGMKICRDAGFEPEVVMELDQLLTAYHLAEAGLGLTFVRASLPVYAGMSEDLCFYAVDHPETTRQIRAVYSPQCLQSPRKKAFIDFLRSSLFSVNGTIPHGA
jgi:LysR family hydrogen peroxide-inducible transcriptional activator